MCLITSSPLTYARRQHHSNSMHRNLTAYQIRFHPYYNRWCVHRDQFHHQSLTSFSCKRGLGFSWISDIVTSYTPMVDHNLSYRRLSRRWRHHHLMYITLDNIIYRLCWPATYNFVTSHQIPSVTDPIHTIIVDSHAHEMNSFMMFDGWFVLALQTSGTIPKPQSQGSHLR